MNIQSKNKFAATAILLAGIASATVVYADNSRHNSGSMMGQMDMMGKMQGVMTTCNNMMQSMMQNSESPMPSPMQSPDHGKTAPDEK